MARPLSEDKRNAVLAAATTVFAERGLSAPTSAVSAAAGVAEGTLFTYFATKDDLINAAYCDVKLHLADAMMSGFPRRAPIPDRLRHVWDQYVAWGLANPQRHGFLRQAQAWTGLTDASRAAGLAPFAEVQQMADEAVRRRVFRDLPPGLVQAAVDGLAEATIALIRRHPGDADAYRTSGYDILWAGIARKR